MRQIFFTTGSHHRRLGWKLRAGPERRRLGGTAEILLGRCFFFGVFSMDLREINGILGWFNEIHINDINRF
jgi:hypothetical protein